MKSPGKSVDRRFLWLLPLLACGIALPSSAQTTPAPLATDTAGAIAAEIVSFPCVEARPEQEIARDVDAAKGQKAEAEAELASAQQMAVSAKGRVTVAKSALDLTKAQLDLAKKEKRDADALRLEALKKRQELELKFAERLAEVRDASVARAAAEKDLAEARQKAYEIEQLLRQRRSALQSLPMGDPAIPAKEKEMRETEQKALDAMNDAASRSKDLADKEKDLVGKRIGLFEVVGEYRKLP